MLECTVKYIVCLNIVIKVKYKVKYEVNFKVNFGVNFKVNSKVNFRVKIKVNFKVNFESNCKDKFLHSDFDHNPNFPSFKGVQIKVVFTTIRSFSSTSKTEPSGLLSVL